MKKKDARKELAKAVELAKKHGLSKMSMEEITEEVKAVRSSKKSNPRNQKLRKK